MSVNINWECLTGGDDGAALAETIRAFIHDRFQQVSLPKMIRSVQVHSFDFGTVAPELELKDISDPLPDFYEESDGGEDGDSDHSEDAKALSPMESSEPGMKNTSANEAPKTQSYRRAGDSESTLGGNAAIHSESQYSPTNSQAPSDVNPVLSRSSTPGIPGGTTNLNYFHQPLSAGLAGPTTPFAAVAGAHLPQGWLDAHTFAGQREDDGTYGRRNSAHAVPTSQPGTTTHPQRLGRATRLDSISEHDQPPQGHEGPLQDRSPDDVQIVMRLRYAGDISMTLTADILLDYPMPSFVGIPLQLRVTGVSFDGIAILAYIKSRAHFCFLGPEDADALVGRENATGLHSPVAQDHRDGELGLEADAHGQTTTSEEQTQRPDEEREQGKRVGGLLEMIKVESEIGQKASGKQVLKNVGKVESFILEQVRRIFETEFVYPSFWTFLV